MLNPLTHAIQYLLLSLALLMGMACQNRPERPMALATARRVAQEPLHLARQMGLLDEKEIRLVEMSGRADCLRALRSGLVQGAAMSLEEACSLLDEDGGFQLALVMGVSKGADALVSRKKIDKLNQLKGLRIGIDQEVAYSQLLSRCLERAGLTMHDIDLVRLPITEQERAFEMGDVDVLVSMEPYRTRLIAMGGHVVFDSREILGEVVEVLIVRKEALKSNTDRMMNMRMAWFKVLDQLAIRSEDAMSAATRRIPMDRSVVERLFQGIEFPDQTRELRLRSGGLDAVVQLISGSMVQQRALKKGIKNKAMCDREMPT